MRRELERASQRRRIAHEEAAALVRLVQPLVRVERDRVGELDPGERLAAALGQRREAPVGRVDVEPGAVLVGDRGEVLERVDRAGVRRAAARADEEGPPTLALVRAHRGRQRGRLEALVLADREHAHVVGAQAEHARRPRDRRVRLVGDVGHGVAGEPADHPLACARECRQVRGGAAAHEQAARALGEAEPRGEPVQHLELDLARAGRLHPRAGVEVGGARDEVAERAGPGAAPGDEREERGVVDAARERQHVARETLEDRVHRLGPVRRRAREALAHLGAGGAPKWRRLGVVEPVDEQVDGAVAQLPHRLPVDPERIRAHGWPNPSTQPAPSKGR